LLALILPPVVLLLLSPLVSVVAVFVLIDCRHFFATLCWLLLTAAEFFLWQLLLLFVFSYTSFCCYFCRGWLILTAFSSGSYCCLYPYRMLLLLFRHRLIVAVVAAG